MDETPKTGLLDRIITGSFYYYSTSLVVVIGVSLGYHFVTFAAHGLSKRQPLLNHFANWDGEWYTRIAAEGYDYDPDTNSSIAFFPVYPLLGRWLAQLIAPGNHPFALLIVAHAALAGIFILMLAYVEARFPSGPHNLAQFTVLALGLFPTSCFFRMAYTESLFIFLALLALYGIERRWPLPVLGVIVGLATATRFTGLALIAPLALHIWHRYGTSWRFFGTSLVLFPLACWGILAFMLYQYMEFEEPIAFAKTQVHWQARPHPPLLDKLTNLLTFEPGRALLDQSSEAYWAHHDQHANPLFSIRFANPFFCLLGVILLTVGGVRHWLSSYELVLGAGLLFIPYVGSGYETYMLGMSRFVSAVFPIYLVLGHILCRIPAPAAAALLATSSFLLCTYAALFSSWFVII